MHRFKSRGGRHMGRHFEAMRGWHGTHGGWGPRAEAVGGACAAATSAPRCSSCSTRAR